MANILYSVYQADNYKPNSKTYEITITVDDEIDANSINTLLPNNGINFESVKGISFLSTNSSATVYTPTMMVIASFCAERGDINSKTTYKEGKWGILAKVPFK